MGFEDSMIEDGFHDEEEYLEYLMDEADREYERQQYEQSTYQDDYEDDNYYDENNEEYYNTLREKYKQWAKNNPLKYKIFIAWIDFDTEWDYEDDNFVLDKFEQWQNEEDWQMERLKDYYHEYYPRIIKYFEWEIDNPIEEILRQPEIEYFRPISEYPYVQGIPECELLIDKMEDYEEWIRNKKKYEQWVSTASEEEKRDFWDMVIDNEFQNDTSIEHTRDCLLKQLDDDKTSDFTKEKVMSWFDEDTIRGQKLFYYIKCVQNYFED